MVRNYPNLRDEYNQLHSTISVSDPSRIAGKSTDRSTENVALRQLPPAKQAEYDAVHKAVEETKHRRSGDERMALINMVFWKESHTLEGAAMALYISYRTARRYHKDFICLVGLYRGLCDYEDVA